MSKLQKSQTIFLDSPLWQRWLQPLQAAKETMPSSFDHVSVINKMASMKTQNIVGYRAAFLEVLRIELATAKTKIEKSFYN